MGLRISKGNMYSWVTHTWNPIKGECPHGCSYCYMHRYGKQRQVRFDESELKTDLGINNFIFVGSSCDIFANDIPTLWLYKTLNHCYNYDNTYLFQSKNPLGILGSSAFLPQKSMVCTTIESNRFYPDIMGLAPKPGERANAMYYIEGIKKYVTIEPIMDFDIASLVDMIWMCKPEQVNIGADSGNNHLPEPSKKKILTLIDELKKFTVIDQKRNLKRLLDNGK